MKPLIGISSLHYQWSNLEEAFKKCVNEYKGMNELGGEPEDFLFIFRNINSPALKFCLDYGHSNLTKNTLSFIKKLHPWLASTHINDNFGLQDEHLGYGEGTVLWNKVLSANLNIGFLGPFVIEFPEKSGKFQIFSSELRELSTKVGKIKTLKEKS